VGGHNKIKTIINMYKLAVFCAVIAAVYAEAEADADAYYGYHYPALYNSYPNWPGVSTPFASSTCFGCRGKRSADAEAEADAYYGHFGYGYGYPYAAYRVGYHGLGVAGHPGLATSYTARSVQGLGKRSADAEPEAEADAYYGYHGYGHGYGYGLGYRSAYYGHGYPYGHAGYRYHY